jgi:hypothetical protein
VATRLYVAFALIVMLSTAWLMSEHFGWVGRGKAAAAKAAQGGIRHVMRIPLSLTVDIDSGRIAHDGADLSWAAQNRGSPQLSGLRFSRMAVLNDVAWEDAGVAHLSSLSYAPMRFAFEAKDSPLRRGTIVAVRTNQGRFAKFRILGRDEHLGIKAEWVTYPIAAGADSVPDPQSAWAAKRDAALANYRGRQFGEALKLCAEGIDIAEQAGSGTALHAQALIRCGEFMQLHGLAPRRIEAWLVRGIAMAERLGQNELTAELGFHERELVLRGQRMLKLLRREYGSVEDSPAAPSRAADPVSGNAR